MSTTYLLLDFSAWYYTRAFSSILSVWLNVMWFIVHFFSIPLLLRTLFSPWKRMTDTDTHHGLESIMEGFVMNSMSRLFGAFVRLTLICTGIATLAIGALSLFVALALWVCMPIVLLVSMVTGIRILIS